LTPDPKIGDLPAKGADGRPWPTLAEALRVWARIALLSFGGPAGQIAVMHRILVEEKRWLGEKRFLHALNFCMLLPGPEAQQLTVYIGWLMHRTAGGLIAGILFVLPGAIAILALSLIYALYGEVDIVVWLFYGLKAAVLAIVLLAVWRIGKRALANAVMVSIAAASFIAIYMFGVAFPLIILVAAAIGFIGGSFSITAFTSGAGHDIDKEGIDDANTLLGDGDGSTTRSSGSLLKIATLLLALWLLPTALLIWQLGGDNVFSEIAIFFSKMAVVTFGGAYAVLAYVAQAAVDTHGWLHAGEMLDGLGLAETTPGPLIMVTQFVGFLGAFREPGVLSPVTAGTLGALLTTWVTFVPCFLWIFIGAPFVEKLRERPALAAAMQAITAAVVGVILNLAVWFGLHVLFREHSQFDTAGLQLLIPRLGSVDIAAAGLCIVAMFAAFRFSVGTGTLLIACAIAGLSLGFAGLAT